MRDPRQRPEVGDVVVIEQHSEMHRHVIEHHLAVTGRTQRKVEVLDGNFDPESGGARGGSPWWMPLAAWRELTASGRATVRAGESMLYGWDAIQKSWMSRDDHDWCRWLASSDYTSCRRCGVVRRADGQNKPCRGTVRVVPRGNPTYSRAPDGPRDRDLRVPVSDGERAEITRRAREAGVPVAEFLRRKALD